MVRVTKQINEELKKEIEDFRDEIDEIRETAKQLAGWNFEFSPFLFIQWRNNGKNRSTNNKYEV